MAVVVDVKNVKAADPGLGFELLLNNNGVGINNSLKVVITITDQNGSNYSSTVMINNPIMDQSLAFVIPFGDANYTRSAIFSFKIEVYIPNNVSSPTQTLTGSAYTDSGQFNFNSNLPASVAPGQSISAGNMMNSMDGRYLGVMQTDGNFCVYKKYALNQSYVENTDSSYSYGNGNNCSLILQNGRIYVTNNNNNTPVSASPAGQAMPGASMVINENGLICLQQPGGKPVQVQVRPGNLP